MSLRPDQGRPDTEPPAAEPDRRPDQDGNERALAAEQRLTVPVLVAALAAVPAAFMMLAGGAVATVGNAVNFASAGVLVGESVLLLALSHHRYAWILQRKWTLLGTAAVVPVVIFFAGPIQVLRIVLYFGTLRVFKVWRIVRAGRVVRERFKLRWHGRRGRLLIAGMTVLATVFLAAVLINPDSATRRLLMWVLERFNVG